MKWFSKWKQSRRWDNAYYRDYGYTDYDPYRWHRSLLKKTAISMAIFGVFVSFHGGEYWTAKMVDKGVHYVVNTNIDLAYLMERIGLAQYSRENIDLSVFKKLPIMNVNKSAPVLSAPLEGKVVGNYGWRTDTKTQEQKFHEGIDWQAPAGTPVKAAADGQVKAVSDSVTYGKTVILQHSGEVETVYGNCTDIIVKTGDPVTQGQIIAKTGKRTDGNEGALYMEVRQKGQAIDPKTKMNMVGP